MTRPNISEAAREAENKVMETVIELLKLPAGAINIERCLIVQRLLDSTQAENVAEIERLREQAALSKGMWEDRATECEALRARAESAERERDAMRYAINEALKINHEVNKLPIGNFYLAETMEGFLTQKGGDEPCAQTQEPSVKPTKASELQLIESLINTEVSESGTRTISASNAASPGPIPADAATPTCLTCSDLKQWGKTIAEPKHGEFKCLECGNSYCREHAKAHFTGSKMDRLGCQSFEIATEAITTLERELTDERAARQIEQREFAELLTHRESILADLDAERAARLKAEASLESIKAERLKG